MDRRSRDHLPVLGITMGDPAGIGPEVIAKALASGAIAPVCRPVVIGSRSVMEQTVTNLGLDLKLMPIADPMKPAPRVDEVSLFDPLEKARIVL